MKLRLEVSERAGGKGHVPERIFSFAIIDLDKAKAYPANFVCMLPSQLSTKGKAESAFGKTFGDKSDEVAKQLLLQAIERETDSEVKAEIERRLKLLEPKPEAEKRCMMCGAKFQAEPQQWRKQKYCPECMKKKFGSRT